LTESDLDSVSGAFSWEVIGAEHISPQARLAHEQGRNFGSRGDNAVALRLFEQAHALAPEWPYPIYDAAFTYLLMGDSQRASQFYARVDAMAPRGYFTAKTMLHSLTRELAGELPAGLCHAFATLEWMDDRQQKRAALEGVLARCPDFAPAWKELSMLANTDAERSAAIERGLAAPCDGETRGILLVNRALLLNKHGDVRGAVAVLGEAALDPSSTLATEMLAKATLSQLARQRGFDS
jgi:tetratricopeptide (TPR) repeat protein